MDRKDFLKKLLVNGSLAAVLPTLLVQACGNDDESSDDNSGDTSNGDGSSSDLEIDLSDPDYSDLADEGGYVVISSKSIIVINTGDDEYAALSSKCTHQGCAVSYNKSANNLPCPCHGSIFNMDGSVKTGPATSPLTVYTTSLADGIITVKLS